MTSFDVEFVYLRIWFTFIYLSTIRFYYLQNIYYYQRDDVSLIETIFRTRLSTYGKFEFPLWKINDFNYSLLQQRIQNDLNILYLAWQKIFSDNVGNYLFEAVWFQLFFLKRSTQLVTMNRTVNRCKLDRRLKANGKLYTNFVRAARLPQYGNFIFCRRDENDIMKTEG